MEIWERENSPKMCCVLNLGPFTSLQNKKNTCGGMKLQATASNFTEINMPPQVSSRLIMKQMVQSHKHTTGVLF